MVVTGGAIRASSRCAKRYPSAAAEERAKARFEAVRWMGLLGVTILLCNIARQATGDG